ncbi:DEAD/DEAH box helicase [Pedobacter sp. SL55]|uniref:DEAD/DEAH box helicase n=1 Tax=Pedobacter sp. SL55 TaxID=2995161 RepID=UPI00226F83B6|nr:DEAD/DEAH box helicase family protein [Pedobacter sp. SL55]WAC39351.1 DEAD/DEAH box helicase family protein [Pedobacter sp. SL55]
MLKNFSFKKIHNEKQNVIIYYDSNVVEKDSAIDIRSLTEIKETVLESWKNNFEFVEEVQDSSGNVTKKGLRPPQIGAIYSLLSYWTVNSKPSTIVLPTGTGKTETMLSVLVHSRINTLLVIVPSDSLRKQLTDKFKTLGVLKEFGIVKEAAFTPTVSLVKSFPKSKDGIKKIFEVSNVVVATMAGLNTLDEECLAVISNNVSHVFIDEAHHIAADTWSRIRSFLATDALVTQFTATPFRNDKKKVTEDIIYNYPLSKAQKDGYFKEINFIAINEFDDSKADEEIARVAVEQLKTDLDNKFDHLLMARTDSINEAERLIHVYSKYKIYEPVVVHSQLNTSLINERIEQLKSRKSRIVICVDMFGEGFDLPQLKIAALHKKHQSLSVLIQFTGRFTRSGHKDIGDATIVANIGNSFISNSLEELYAEDSDWNKLLRIKSSGQINDEIDSNEFFKNFDKGEINLSLSNVRPKTSTVIYKTKADKWTPSKFRKGFKKDADVASIVNNEDKVLLIVEKNINKIDWGAIKDIENVSYDLYIVHFDVKSKLLYIHGSNNSSLFKELAESVVKTPALVSGEPMFRAFYNLNRLMLFNIGLNNLYAGHKKYTMYAGFDAGNGISQITKDESVKSNIFGVGFENGEKVSVGCSYKGRVWSRQAVSIGDYITWCKNVSKKILDTNIDPNVALQTSLKREIISKLPSEDVLTVDWPELYYESPNFLNTVSYNNVDYSIDYLSIELSEVQSKNSISFKIVNDDKFSVEFELTVDKNGFKITQKDTVKLFSYKKGQLVPLEEFFQNEPPQIRYINSSLLAGNVFIDASNHKPSPFDIKFIEVIDWTGTDITKESQKVEKRIDSIQKKMIDNLVKENNLVVFDDDDSGEIADIVIIKDIIDATVNIELYHCKFSKTDSAGSRVDDFYAVCGQTQKSINWKINPEKFFKHLLKRHADRLSKHSVGRIEKGDISILNNLKKNAKKMRLDFKCFIVQPGLSKNAVSTEILTLLGSTELYLKETYNIPLIVYSSV